MIATEWKDYSVIKTGNGEKLERWGDVILLRPDPQVIWKPSSPLENYDGLHARYVRSARGGGEWQIYREFPLEWTINYKNLTFLIKPMGFKHTGLFPEQAVNWEKMQRLILAQKREIKVLNLFGYTGGATVALASVGAKVTHVDASKGMVDRCKQNCTLSNIPADRVRFIVDDCKKFVTREIKRNNRYDAVIMDPPSYGRGPNGETWRIEDDVFNLVELVKDVLSDNPLFFLINSYTTGLQSSVMCNVLNLALGGNKATGYEVLLPTQEEGIVLPCGNSAIWIA